MGKKLLIFTLPLAAAAVGVTAGIASAAGTTVIPPNTVHGCITGTTRTLEHVYGSNTKGTTCPTGTTLVIMAKPSTAGTGPSTVTAQTAITNWPESSGWANDNMTRTVTLTSEGQVPASNCGATATSCYFYSETLADNGNFAPVDGHATPNGSDTTDTITAANITGTTFSGGGKLEFYASSGTPNPALVPGTATGAGKGGNETTTNWYKLFFPAGTQFGLTSAANAPWLTYDWVYGASLNYTSGGTSISCSQQWNDGINPGDDGQGAGDGNITGTCPTS